MQKVSSKYCSYVHARIYASAHDARLKSLFFLVVATVMRRFAVVTGRDCDLGQIATTVFVVVILARIYVAHDSLLIFHNSPPDVSVNVLTANDTWG